MHKALGPDAKFHFVNVAEWESAEHFLAALNNPEVQRLTATQPKDIKYYPGLYQVIRT